MELISKAAAIDAIVGATVLVDAAAIRKICEERPLERENWLGGVLTAIDAVEDVNTVETVPVVHGRWYDKGSLSCRCSCCGCKSNKEYNYCPHCGAKMDRDGE